MNVEISYESKRECGYRHAGAGGFGLYLMGDGVFEPCERLPFPLSTCPCCGAGIKFSRGFTWINPMALFDPYSSEPRCLHTMAEEDIPPYMRKLKHNHEACWMCNPELLGARAGLLWVGEQTYATAQIFRHEAKIQGISRRVPHIPKDFVVGTDVVFLAHNKVIPALDDKGRSILNPAVFMSFRPHRVDIVIDDPEDVPAAAVALAERLGDKARIVKVIPLDTAEETNVEEW